jgi:NAD+ synthetase
VPAVGQDNYMTFNDRIRLGNVKARLRMIHLYDLAKAYGGIVIGTDNYTEQVLGFSTIGGDALFDYCPIQKLWKTEVYELAYYYKKREIEMGNWAAVHALDESLEIKPQAGLGITASDMDEIGAPDYFAVDDVLYNDEHGIEQPDKPYVETVLRRKRENAYKRNLPIIINREEIDNAK